MLHHPHTFVKYGHAGGRADPENIGNYMNVAHDHHQSPVELDWPGEPPS